VAYLLRRAVFWVLISMALMVFIGHQFFRWVDQDYSDELRQAEEMALSQSVLTRVDEANHFAGEESFFVFQGPDALNQLALVWVSLHTNEIHTEYAADGVTKEEVLKKVYSEHPQSKLQRIVPGKLGSDWVWEVFFLSLEEDRYVYQYYDFYSGKLLRTYKLNKSIGKS
jgi:uncharacterized protein YpmB